MTEPREPGSESNQPPAAAGTNEAPQQPAGRGERPPDRSRKRPGGRGTALYTFADGREHCFCRNATRVPPKPFPVTAREGVATPSMIVLAMNDSMVLLCDLLHEGPHLWPDGELVFPESRVSG